MAAEVKPLQPLRLPAGPAPLTPEQRYWRTFKSPQLIPAPNTNPITHISFPQQSSSSSSFSPSPDAFAVTSGSRIQIFSSRTRKVTKTISRFGVDDVAHSGEIRPDGRVLAAGGDSGAIQVFDTNSRAILKTWREHKQPVWTTKWDPLNATHLLSTSDDRTARLWDLTENDSITKFHGHQDYVRSGVWMPGQSAGLVATGSYDQTVRLWDPRAPEKAAMIFKHAAPIESVLAMPNGMTLLSTSDNSLSILDLVAARPLEVLRPHQKTITSLALASNNTRVVTGALDGHIKIFDPATWTVVAGAKYPSPVLSLAVIPGGPQAEDRHLAVGLQNGLLSLKTRLSGTQKALESARAKEMQALLDGRIAEHDQKVQKKRKSGIEKKLRGLGHDGSGADIVIEDPSLSRKRKRLQPWERALRQRQYGTALDSALAKSPPDPPTVFSCLIALKHASAIPTALRGRDEVSLQPVLKWLIKHLANPSHVVLTTSVSMQLLELYAPNLGKSAAVDTLVDELHERVRGLVDVSLAAVSTGGMLDLVMADG